DNDDEFLGAPSGATEFRSYGAADQFLNSGSINIHPLCGPAKIDDVLNYSHPTPNPLNPALRLGLLCVKGLREEAGHAIVRARNERPFTSLDDLHRRVPELRKDELRKLAAVGALNFVGEGVGGRVLGLVSGEVRGQRSEVGTGVQSSESKVRSQKVAQQTFDNEQWSLDEQLHPKPNTLHPTAHRRDALWQVERVSREPGPLYEPLEETDRSPLEPMSLNERLNADLRGTGITIGRHPMAHQREWLNTMKV